MRLLSRVSSVLSIVALSGAALALTAAPAQAVVDPTPVGPVGWVPDGPVLAAVATETTVYVGGSFTGGVAALDATTGALKWTGSVNGVVRAVALAGYDSRVLVAGDFTTVGGATHRNLASVDTATGAVDNTFKGAAGGVVRDIVVTGDTAYFGGTFLMHGGMAQRGLGAVSATTGKLVTDFVTSTDGDVYGVATDGARLYFSGKFTAVSQALETSPRNQVASLTLGTGLLDPWAPLRACTSCNIDWDLTVDSERVYVVGRNAAAVQALDKVTGLRLWRRTPNASGDAQAVTIGPDGLLYVGGHFVRVMGEPRLLLAALDPATGALQPFSTRFVTTWPGIWALASSSSRLFVGGHFTAAGPAPNRFPFLTVFSAG